MTTALYPPVYVAAPAVTPYGAGLYSVAQLPAEPGDRWQTGVEYEPDGCAEAASVWVDSCVPGDRADKDVPEGIPVASGDPFTVIGGLVCRLVGHTEAELMARARRNLELGEQRAVETAFWGGALGNTPHLADTSTTVVSGAAGLSLVDGVGLLEEHLATNYAGVGVLHAARRVAAPAAQKVQAVKESGRLVTNLGTRWAFYGGAPNTGPDGTPAAAGSAWIYATGEVVIRRSEIWMPDVGELLNRTTNEVALIAERTVVITTECITAAALVDLAA